MSRSTTITVELTELQTRFWEDPGPEGDTYRAFIRAQYANWGRPIEVRSHDGITLDAWVSDPPEGY